MQLAHGIPCTTGNACPLHRLHKCTPCIHLSKYRPGLPSSSGLSSLEASAGPSASIRIVISTPASGGLIRSCPTMQGAAITHKSVLETPNHDVIKAVAQHVAQAYRALTNPGGPGAGLVIVHGAGSFGHHQACLHGVSNGWGSGSVAGVAPAGLQQGFVVTRASVAKLNCIVVDALIAGEWKMLLPAMLQREALPFH